MAIQVDDAIRKFRSRRAGRMGLNQEKEKDPVARYRERRYTRLMTRLDADEGEDKNTNGNGGGHGNTHIPFGLCEREGIEVQPDWTPKDAWDALEGKGYDAKQVYKELKETGKVPKRLEAKPEKPKMSDQEATKIIKGFQKTKREIGNMTASLNRTIESIEYDAGMLSKSQKKMDSLKDRIEKLESDYGDPKKMTGYVLEEYNRLSGRLNEEKADFDDRTRRLEILKERRESLKNQIRDLKDSEEGKKYQEAIMSKFPTYNECTTANEVLERMSLNEYFKDDGSSFGRINVESARALAKEFDMFFEKVPEMKGRLGHVELRSIHNWGQSWPGGVVELNSKVYGNRKWFEQQVEYAKRIGFHPQGTTAAGILFHEYTHQIDDYMTKKLGLSEPFSTVVYKELVDRLEKSKSKLLEIEIPASYSPKKANELYEKMKMERIRTSVSDYAHKDPRGHVHKDHTEFLAEAYNEYLDSNSPREVATIVGEIVGEYLKKLEVRK